MTPSHQEGCAAVFESGVQHHRAGRLGKARLAFTAVLRACPSHAWAKHLLGMVEFACGRTDVAASLLQESILLAPRTPQFHANLGLVLEKTGRYDDAAQWSRSAIALDPTYTEAYHNLGNQLAAKQQFSAAVAAFRAAIQLNPDWDAPRVGLYRALTGLDQPLEALGVAESLARLLPSDLRALRLLAAALQSAGRPADAVHPLLMARALGDDDPRTRVNLALAWLQSGEFSRGWEEYEWRWKCPELASDYRGYAVPRWDGSALNGRTILVYSEQGLGSTIQFARYAVVLAEKAAHVVVECQPALVPILSTLPGVKCVVARGESLPHADVQAPLMSLPVLLGTRFDTIPAPIPYLYAVADLVRSWRGRLDSDRGLKVGICWRGSPAYARDRFRSAPLSALTPLTKVEGVHLYTLQKGPGEEEISPWLSQLSPQGRARVTVLSDRLDRGAGAFLDTAAVLVNLDLIITVDTSIGHLAGAIGREVWLALNFAPDWRWIAGCDDSPWYPATRLFRQSSPGDWIDLFERIAETLDARSRTA